MTTQKGRDLVISAIGAAFGAYEREADAKGDCAGFVDLVVACMLHYELGVDEPPPRKVMAFYRERLAELSIENPEGLQ